MGEDGRRCQHRLLGLRRGAGHAGGDPWLDLPPGVYWEQPRFARFMRRLSRDMRVLHFDKRGVGMSDRFGRPPDLETRMDDVRAIMDAAGVERAALFGWGTGGPPLAVFFAATHPERALAVCADPDILERRSADYPWAETKTRSSVMSRNWVTPGETRSARPRSWRSVSSAAACHRGGPPARRHSRNPRMPALRLPPRTLNSHHPKRPVAAEATAA